MKELSVIKEFVNSLEKNELSEEQQAILLEGGSDVYGGVNATCVNHLCINDKPSCEQDLNYLCTNIPNCTCTGGGDTGGDTNSICPWI